MDTPQDKIREFFWELDKIMGPNHPFIVMHGPAYTFREYLERNIEDTTKIHGLEDDVEGLEDEIDTLKDDIKALEDTISDTVKKLKSIDLQIDSEDDIQETIDEVIQDLKDAL